MQRKTFSKVLSLLVAALLLCAIAAPSILAEESKITVSVGIYDYTAVSYGCDKASDSGIVTTVEDLEVDSTATAFDAICAALDKEGITYDVDSQYGYFTQIGTLSAFDCGSKSGWMFSVNNDFGNMGASATAVSDGDALRLDYSVQGYGTDVGSYFAGGPAITSFSLCGSEVKISSHTVYAGEDDYTGVTSYYIGEYTEGAENTSIAGDGSAEAPFEIPVSVAHDADITAAAAQVKSTLHEKYMFYAAEDGLCNIAENTDYSAPVTFALETMGGIIKTYYKVSVTKKNAPVILPDYESDWPLFRGNEENMAITNAKTPKTAKEAKALWQVQHSPSWEEPITLPIIVNGELYIAKKNKIVKISAENGKIIASSDELAGDMGYGLNPLTYGGGMIFAALGEGRVQALRADTLQSLWVSETVEGQMLTTVSYHNGYIYTGTWNSDTAEGTYFALSAADEDADSETEIKTCAWKIAHNGGFYFAGAYVTDNFAVFGSDDGARDSAPQTSVLYSVNPTSGEIIDTIEGIAGDIRSTVAYDKETDRLYFLTRSGELYNVSISQDGHFDKSDIKTLSTGGSCTGTPVVHDGLAYFGVSGANLFSDSEQIFAIADVTVNPMKLVKTVNIAGYAQGSALLTTAYEESDSRTYIYTTYNNLPGGIQVVSVSKNGTDGDGAAKVSAECSDLFFPGKKLQQYCLCSLVCDNEGTIYYKNDSGYLFAIERKESGNDEQRPSSSRGQGNAGTAIATPTPTQEPVSDKTDKPSKKHFSDVPDNHWAREYIELLTEYGIISGRSEELFAPDDNVTRAEFCALLHRMSGEEDISSDFGFSDVSKDDWFAADVAWAADKGIAKGVSDECFAPCDKITRQDMAVMIQRYMLNIKLVLSTDGENAEFDDIADIADYARESVKAMRSAGIISGNGNNKFAPTAFATRAQCAKMLSMIMK